MTLEDFGRMNDDDEAGYVAFLVEASGQMLKARGHADQAAQVVPLFKDTSKDGGVQLFAYHLKSIYRLNKKNAINPNNRAPVYQVEDAMAQTLRDKGIMVPAKDLIEAGKGFHPEGPMRQHILGN